MIFRADISERKNHWNLIIIGLIKCGALMVIIFSPTILMRFIIMIFIIIAIILRPYCDHIVSILWAYHQHVVTLKEAWRQHGCEARPSLYLAELHWLLLWHFTGKSWFIVLNHTFAELRFVATVTHHGWFCTETVKIVHAQLNSNKKTSKITDVNAFTLFLF